MKILRIAQHCGAILFEYYGVTYTCSHLTDYERPAFQEICLMFQSIRFLEPPDN